MTVGFGFRQRNEIVVVPISTVFAFTQLRSTMPGAPDGFGDILDIPEHKKREETMKVSVEWFRKDCAYASTCATGRVTLALLANVWVKKQRSEEMAAVGYGTAICSL
ncbi:hypothetical protein EDD18DRAFT_1357741 [Armillaria luteobubalina]|uniref:Uncharacterized protein n=1 Tax=Armillaria luteobubalina TaxID=153913 RepID=A0AA39PZF7_9AGAR|nr:hypothetical protein EDD18DRAFT_1357741 [Armillaria luteobubalina]